MAAKVDLFEDIAVAIDSWAGSGTAAITDRSTNLEWTEDSEPYRVLQSLLADGDSLQQRGKVTSTRLAKLPTLSGMR